MGNVLVRIHFRRVWKTSTVFFHNTSQTTTNDSNTSKATTDELMIYKRVSLILAEKKEVQGTARGEIPQVKVSAGVTITGGLFPTRNSISISF